MQGIWVLLPFIALIPAFIAKRKGLGFWTFYVFGLLLWIVALPVAIFSKDRRRRCPHCIEVIHPQATACPHCQRSLVEDGATAPSEPLERSQSGGPTIVAPSLADQSKGNGIIDNGAVTDEGSEQLAPQARRSKKRTLWLLASVLAIVALVGGIVALSQSSQHGGGGPSDAAAATPRSKRKVTPARSCSAYRGAKPRGCISKTGFACSSYDGSAKPNDCFTRFQLRVRARIAKSRAVAAAKARARAAAAAAAQAKAQAAADAAANAWHQGYNQQDGNVYWKWMNSGSCADYTSNGCWHVEVITDTGCSSYVAVHANEYSSDHTIINSLLDNQGYGIPPRTTRLFELDADQDNVTAGDVTIDCQ